MRFLFVYIILFFLITSCKKEQIQKNSENCNIINEEHSNDILEASEFLVSTPGSWWEYTDGIYQEAEFLTPIKTYDFKGKFLGCNHYNEDILYTQKNPFLGQIHLMNQITTNEETFTTTQRPVLDTVPGVFYESVEYGSQRKTTYERKVIGLFDSLSIQGTTYYDVIKAQHYLEVNFNGGPTYMEIKRYTFARNVGIIRFEYPIQSIDAQLIDYHIAE